MNQIQHPGMKHGTGGWFRVRQAGMRVRTDDPLCEAGQVGVHSVAPLIMMLCTFRAQQHDRLSRGDLRAACAAC